MNISISRLLLIAAVLVALLTGGIAAYLQWSRPVHLRVAAGPRDGVDAMLLVAFDHLLDINRAGVRLDLVATAGIHDSNLSLEKRDVDLAVVRLDDPLPTGAALVALLRTNVVVAVAPARHKLESLSDVKDKRVGLVSRTPLDEPSFVRVLDMFGIKPADVKLTIVKPEEVAALTSSGQIDCVVVLGAPADPEVMAVVYAVDGKKKSPPTILERRSRGIVEGKHACGELRDHCETRFSSSAHSRRRCRHRRRRDRACREPGLHGPIARSDL